MFTKIVMVTGLMVGASAAAPEAVPSIGASEAKAVPESIYEVTVKDIDGKDVTLDKYRGNVLLLVNVASK